MSPTTEQEDGPDFEQLGEDVAHTLESGVPVRRDVLLRKIVAGLFSSQMLTNGAEAAPGAVTSPIKLVNDTLSDAKILTAKGDFENNPTLHYQKGGEKGTITLSYGNGNDRFITINGTRYKFQNPEAFMRLYNMLSDLCPGVSDHSGRGKDEGYRERNPERADAGEIDGQESELGEDDDPRKRK